MISRRKEAFDNGIGDEGVAKSDLLILQLHYEFFKLLDLRQNFNIIIKLKILKLINEMRFGSLLLVPVLVLQSISDILCRWFIGVNICKMLSKAVEEITLAEVII